MLDEVADARARHVLHVVINFLPFLRGTLVIERQCLFLQNAIFIRDSGLLTLSDDLSAKCFLFPIIFSFCQVYHIW